ncbi:hypothetical protein ACHAPJ_006546 [Fusarium lateritium]
MAAITKVVNGKVVSNTNQKPPRRWTNDYEEMRGDNEWAEDGYAVELIRSTGLEGQIKPLFMSLSESEEVRYLIEVEGQYYLYSGESGEVKRIVGPTDLEEIVDFINESGAWYLDTEDI